MKDTEHILVIDLGKTNKKISVLDRKLNFIFSETKQFPGIKENNIECDDIKNTLNWLFLKLRELSKKFNIKVISTSTYGATVTHLDEKGELALPVISYTHEPEKEIRNKFYKTFGDEKELYLKTATPPFGQFLTVAMQLFWIKEKMPEKWNKVKKILFLPQYIGYIFTGKSSIEWTSIGCHTYLYDFIKKDYSKVAKKLGIVGTKMDRNISLPLTSLGNIKKDISKLTGINEQCLITTGIHDSNSSLLPYLLGRKQNFLLASTGTWCVFMFPGGKFHLDEDDIEKDTLYYIDPFSRPVRAARFKGGEEHDYYCNLIEKKFGSPPYKTKFNLKIVEDILKKNECFVIPSLTQGCGQFPHSKPRIIREDLFFKNIEYSYHLLSLSLAIQSYFAIKQAAGSADRLNIYVEGGFRKNDVYLKLLSSIFPYSNIYSTNLNEATSIGAGICGKILIENKKIESFDSSFINIEEKLIEKNNINHNHLRKYIEKFKNYCLEK